MATLTAAEIAHIRRQVGDNCNKFDADYMQWLHDQYGSVTPLCTADPLGATIVWVLRTLEAGTAVLFDEDGESTRNVSQKHAHYKALREEWEARCGMSGGAITTSNFDTGMDADCDTEYSTYPHSRSWYWGQWL